MGRHDPLNEADQGFFDAIIGDEQTKTAVVLEPSTVDALGIPSVSRKILDDLEAQASGVGSSEESTSEQKQPEAKADRASGVQGEPEGEVQNEEAVEVAKFDRTDAEPPKTEAVEPELPSRASHGKLFSDKRSHPIQILEVLTARYKTEWVGWESDTLWWSIRRSFGPVGDVIRNKIMALRLAVTTDMTWEDWDTFEDSGLAWNDIVPTIGSFQPMTPMQVAFAVQVLREIRPDEEFAHEVRAYIAAILDDHGWIWAPEEYFGDVQQILGRGREHLVGLKQEVTSAWEKIKDVDPQTIEWTDEEPLSIHLLKLFVVKSYLDGREALRKEKPGAAATSSTVSPPVP